MNAINLRDMATMNRAAVLAAVHRAGALSRVEIAAHLGLTPTAITRIAGDLVELGLLREHPDRQATRGRPRAPLEINPDWARVVAVSISHRITIGAVDLAGRLLGMEVVADETQTPKYDRELHESLPAALRRWCESEASDRLLGVGALVAGRVNRTGVMLYNFNLAKRDPVDIRRMLAAETDLPVHVDEEFRLLLRRYVWQEGPRARRNVVVMSGQLLGSGGGQAALVNGELCCGRRGLAGQSGKFMAVLHPPRVQQAMWDRIASLGGNDAYLAALRDGSAEARGVYEAAVANFGFRLAQVVNHFDPELVLLHSAYDVMGDQFLADVLAAMREHVESFDLDGLEVRHAGPRTDELRLCAAAGPVLEQVFVGGWTGEAVAPAMAAV